MQPIFQALDAKYIKPQESGAVPAVAAVNLTIVMAESPAPSVAVHEVPLAIRAHSLILARTVDVSKSAPLTATRISRPQDLPVVTVELPTSFVAVQEVQLAIRAHSLVLAKTANVSKAAPLTATRIPQLQIPVVSTELAEAISQQTAVKKKHRKRDDGLRAENIIDGKRASKQRVYRDGIDMKNLVVGKRQRKPVVRY
jgi:hypothetical protein